MRLPAVVGPRRFQMAETDRVHHGKGLVPAEQKVVACETPTIYGQPIKPKDVRDADSEWKTQVTDGVVRTICDRPGWRNHAGLEHRIIHTSPTDHERPRGQYAANGGKEQACLADEQAAFITGATFDVNGSQYLA